MVRTAKAYRYTVHLEPAEEGGYVVTVPALPGCVTQGETYEEAIEMARDVIAGWVETLATTSERLSLSRAAIRSSLLGGGAPLPPRGWERGQG